MVEVQICEVHAIPAAFSLAQQWVGIDKHCWVRQETMTGFHGYIA
jgi:hypothetical protein